MQHLPIGKVVSAGSVAAKGQRHNVPYIAVEDGIYLFTLAVAKDVGDYNMNVNCVSPGAVHTTMLRGWLKDLAINLGVSEDDAYSTMCQHNILGRGSLPRDISNEALYLCFEESRNVNGHGLYINVVSVY